MARVELIRDYLRPSVRRSRAIVSPIDFRAAARAAGLFTALPGWFVLTCATTARTVQTGPASLVAGLGANAKRAYSHDGVTAGLLEEMERKNQIPTSDYVDAGSWFAGVMAAATGEPDPAGGTAAVKFTSTGDQYSNFDIALDAPSRVFSTWAQRVSGSSPSAHYHVATENVDVTATAWTRLVLVIGANDLQSMIFDTRDEPSGAGVLVGTRVLRAYGPQAEASALYPSSYIPTTGLTRTRAADVSGPYTASALCPGGYFHFVRTFAPLYATAEQSADRNLFYLDANNRVFLRQSDAKVVMRIGGADIASAALSWSRNQPITVEAIHSRRLGRRLIVNGTAVTASAASAITLPANLYLGGTSSGAEECDALHAIGLYREAAA